MTRRVVLPALALLAVTPAQAADPDADAATRALWKRHCSICHLQGGTGTFMLSRRLGADRALLEQRDDLDADYVRTVVRHGIQSMPRFSRAELPDEDLARIARYLAPKKP